MFLLIIIVAIVGLWVWWKMSHYNDSTWVKDRIKGRNDDQKGRTRQTLWGGRTDANSKTVAIRYMIENKLVPLHYES